MRVLAIEDNPKILGLLEQGLTEHGYEVHATTEGHVGERRATEEQFDAIVLDLMLPDCDGVELCRNLRRQGVETPIIVLTALAETADKVEGLNAGADDYLAKPFEFDELVARLNALTRRAGTAAATTLTYADLELDLIHRTCRRGETEIELTRKEFALLEFFLRHPEQVLDRETIGQQVWDMDFDPFSNVIDVYVSMLRRKIDKPFAKPLIHTVIGTGYTFSEAAPVA